MGEVVGLNRHDASGHGESRSMTDSLSQRERQILVYATAGLTDQAMANKLGISRATVTTYWGRVRTKFGAYGRTELVANFVREQANLRNENLAADEGLFRGIAECCPFGIFFAGPESNCLYANPAWLKLAGISAEETLGEGWKRAIHPDDLDRVQNLWVIARSNGETYVSTTRYVRPDGTIRWVRTQAVARYDRDVLVGFLGMVEDITEARLARIELEEREEELEDLIRLTPSALISIDANFDVVRINPATEHLLGYSADELVGRPLTNLLPAESRSKHVAGFTAFANSNQNAWIPRDGVYVSAITKAGETVWCEGSFVKHSSKGQSRYTAILRDVTEKLEAEAKHEASQAKYRALIGAISQFVWTATPDAMVVDGSEWESQYAGIDVKGLEGRGWTAIMHPDDVGLIIRAAKDAARERRSWEIHSRLRRADGEYRWHVSKVTPILDTNGDVKLWVGATMDVHDERQTAGELCAAQQILDATPDIVVSFGEDGAILYANSSAKALGDNRQPKSLGDLFTADTVRKIRSRKGGGVWLSDGLAVRKNGSPFAVSLVCIPPQQGDHAASIIARDLSNHLQSAGKGIVFARDEVGVPGPSTLGPKTHHILKAGG